MLNQQSQLSCLSRSAKLEAKRCLIRRKAGRCLDMGTSNPKSEVPSSPSSEDRRHEQLPLARQLTSTDVATVGTGIEFERQFMGLGLTEITEVAHDSCEFNAVDHYFHQSHPGGTEHDEQRVTGKSAIVVESIFRIAHPMEGDNFAMVDLQKAKDDRKLLWHGSRFENIPGILRQGLRVAPPEAMCNGTRWGKGLYFADESRKAFQYCHPEDSQGSACVLLCEVQIGNPVLETDGEDGQAVLQLQEKGLLALRYNCWEGWTWVDAGVIHSQLSGVFMPSPDASRHAPGLRRSGRGHNEVCACYRFRVSRIQ
jgi:hypothetical protein